MVRRFAGLVFITVLATANGQQMRGALTNASIVTLASAGFNEQFIVDTIAVSHTQFDTSVEAMAALAKQGIGEGVIRAMTTAASPRAASSNPSPNAAPQREMAKPPTALKAKPIAFAIGAHTQYWESREIFWGLYKKRVGVGSGTAGQDGNPAAQHLGAMYESVRASDGANGH